MLTWKKIVWLRERIKDQKAWIDRCGGSLLGYIEHYGDPGIPPLKDGLPKTITIPVAQQNPYICKGLERVPDTNDKFYSPCFGDGGTAIYNADYDRLVSWQNELNNLQLNNHSALVKANKENYSESF